jgi:hypothetical protein
MMWNIRCVDRLLGRRTGRLPDFLCIGAQKAGTTTLHGLLQEHPGVHMPPEKEIHYFSCHFHRSLRWYRSRFAGARPDQRIGEISPYYLFHPEAPARIAASVPDVRLIALVRDPVERALSGYFHVHRHGREPLPIEAAFEAEEQRLVGAGRALAAPGGRHDHHQWHSYLARSRYDEQLARYGSLFPASQLLVIRSEDLFADPGSIVARVIEFLGLEPQPLQDLSLRRNAGNGEADSVPLPFRLELRRRLQPTYDAMRRVYAIEWPEPVMGGGRDAP